MGMFDYVNIEVNCPKCSKILNNFQTKETCCLLETVDPTEIYYTYSRCECGYKCVFTRDEINKPKRSTPFNLEELHALGFKGGTND